MKIAHINDVEQQHMHQPLFTGEVIRQSPVKDSEGSDLNIDYVSFPKGVRNKFHSHTNDQVLIVTHGRGILATETEEREVKEGDIIWVPAGEVHWHGATPDSDFTHISITKAQTKIVQVQE